MLKIKFRNIYNINIVQGDDEIYDYEIGGNANEITIYQSN